ncbi:MAG: 16S rRNA (cytosine967-C5)-methyltransferase [Alphaproteobacteria bacterium]|jgi:16S rRNA (cytosine967-C5)-methyltransferase
MRYGAQVQAAIDLYNEIGRSNSPADKCMSNYFRNRRFIGSKDKATIAGLIYGLMRRMGEVDYLIESVKGDKSYRMRIFVYMLLDGSTKQLIENICSGDTFAPGFLNNEEKKNISAIDFAVLKNAPDCAKYNYPRWMEYSLKRAYGKQLPEIMEAMNQQATTDIRVNTLKGNVDGVLAALIADGFEMRKTEYSRNGLRMDARKSIFVTDSFKKGRFEMQDEGSQLIAELCAVKPGQKVVDFCAGAGGKTLALSACMENKGGLQALDIHERRLNEMPKRLKRAGVQNVRTKVINSENDKWVKRHKETQDVVLVDAPCSGAGTWRRNPDSRWKLTQDSLTELNDIQHSILMSACRMVKKGGRLIYATCSVLEEENEDQVKAFLEARHDFKIIPVNDVETQSNMPVMEGDFLKLNPYAHKVDGFFVAVLERTQSSIEESAKIAPKKPAKVEAEVSVEVVAETKVGTEAVVEATEEVKAKPKAAPKAKATAKAEATNEDTAVVEKPKKAVAKKVVAKKAVKPTVKKPAVKKSAAKKTVKSKTEE